MGYKRKTYKLTWPDDHELSGLEVKTSGLSIGELDEMAKLRSQAEGATNIEKIRPLIESFSESLISWNYEDDDENPIGIDLETLMKQDFRFLLGVITEWMGAVSDVPAPLSRGSSNGAKFQVPPIPMEISSPNLQNLTLPN